MQTHTDHLYQNPPTVPFHLLMYAISSDYINALSLFKKKHKFLEFNIFCSVLVKLNNNLTACCFVSGIFCVLLVLFALSSLKLIQDFELYIVQNVFFLSFHLYFLLRRWFMFCLFTTWKKNSIELRWVDLFLIHFTST